MTAETRCAPTIHEASAWMRGVVAKRVRQIEDLHIDTPAYGVIVAPLGSSGAPGSRADRECDRCNRFVTAAEVLHLISYHVAPRIILCCGLCSACAQLEASR